MNKVSYFFIFLFALFTGCYEDKGNYDYIDIQDIELKKSLSFSKTVGDTISIKPEFNIDIPENSPYLTYEWSINGETRPDDPNWNARNFFWIADEQFPPFTPFALKIRDSRYDIKYVLKGTCDVSGEFDASFSWTILAEKDGETILSFFKSEEAEWNADYSVMTITEWKEYNDLYPLKNAGQKLGRGPLSMREHYSDERNAVGQVWVFTKDGATDLDGAEFRKDITLNQTFMGGGVPEGVVIQGGVFMRYADILYDQNGCLYSRVKSEPMLFNSGYFLRAPIKFEGKTLEQCEPVLGRYTNYNGVHTPIIDRKNNRLLVYMDGTSVYGYDELTGAGHVLALPAPTLSNGEKLPDNYIPLDNFEGYELLYMCFKKVTSSGLPGFNALFKDAAGRFFLEEFALRSSFDALQGVYLRLTNIKVHDLSGKLTQVPSLMSVPPNTATDYVFFAIDNVLYMYDKDTKIWSEYLRFNAPITAMDADNHFRNMYFNVGLENGEFYVININNAKNRPLEERIMCTSKTRFGKIIQINFKIGNKGSWT